MQDIYAYIDQQADEYIAQLRTLLKQPSVAAQNLGMAETAELVRQMLADIDAAPRLIDTRGGFPVVYGDVSDSNQSDAPVLSFYNHYDVQPADPLDLWDSDPWLAEILDGRIWARGVADNKGNLVARIAAVQAYQHVRGKLPLSVKFIVEGEEEIGSPHLEHFTKDHPDLCRSDGCIWEFGGKDLDGRPLMHLGLKGMCYVELRVRGAKSDQHSSVATSVPNAAWRLIWALNSLKRPDEVVRIPGFYDNVKPPTSAELDALVAMPDLEDQRREHFGIESFLLGLSGLDLKVRDYFQPTCTVAGIESGYTGEGTKTVLPAFASAKVDMRLCADQDPNEIVRLIRAHLDAEGFEDVEVVPLSLLYPARTSLAAPLVKVVADSYRELYGVEPVMVPTSSGSGPWYQLCHQFGIDACSAGVGNARSQAHAPNENIFVDDFIIGIKHVCLIMERFAASSGRSPS